MDEPQPTWTEVSRTSDRRKCEEHELVLQAMRIPNGRMQAEDALLLLVRTQDAARAREQIERYERENANWPPREEVPLAISDGVQAGIVYAAVLALVFFFERRGTYGLDWWKAGAARSAAIQSGEWWRALTALSLHTDLSHLLGNLFFGAVFGAILAQSLGSGLAWAGFALSGALGNLANALVRRGDHVSVGASTGVFGALGLQVAYEWMRRRELRTSRLRRWGPVAMGIALLLWLGTGGFSDRGSARETEREIAEVLDRVDVMAHLAGFAAGLGLGGILGALRRRIRLRGRWQAALGWGVVLVLGGAWALALAAR